VHAAQKAYMLIMFQFYLHEMLGAAVGVLPKFKIDMIIHHVATMGLISTAYTLNLNRYGIMWQALFDISNPLLHFAKTLHAARVQRLQGLKWVLFNAFAAAFFIARVAAAPFSIMYPAFTRALAVLPAQWCYFLQGLMVVVCGIQWVWFSRIVALARGGSHSGEGEEQQEGKVPTANGKAKEL
jgi:ceramide synthetase